MSPKILSIVAGLCLIGSSVSGQQVQALFPELILSENFEHANNYWATVANSENLFIVQEGEYILNRKSTSSPYAVIGNFDEPIQNFRMVSSLKLEKSVIENPSMGVAFMLQDDNSGGFILEINTQKQYRIKKILEGSYQYLSGTPTNSGWVNNENIHEKNIFNLIEVKSDNGVFDVYINNEYMQSFKQPGYPAGRMGYILAAGTQGRVDFIYLFGKERQKYMASASTVINPTLANSSASLRTTESPDVLALAESIIKLKTQINDLKQENEELKWTINARDKEEIERKENEEFFKGQIRTLQNKVNSLQVSYDSIQNMNKKLERYKKIVGDDENADLIITLSKTVKLEKKNNEELKAKNDQLIAENAATVAELEKLKSQLAKISTLLTGEAPATEPVSQPASQPPASQDQGVKKNTSKGFVLPSDPN